MSEQSLSAETLALAEAGRNGFAEGVNIPGVSPPAAPVVPPAVSRPDHIPEKFWDAEKGAVNVDALAKSYTELEKFKGAKPAEQEPAANADPEAPPAKIEKPAEAAAESPVASAIQAAREVYAQNGELTDEALEGLRQVGFDDNTINAYLAGVKAQEAAFTLKVYELAGGQDVYAGASDWAAKNFTDTEVEAYNAALDNPQLMSTAIQGLVARYRAAVPSEGGFVKPSSVPAVSHLYTDKDQFLRDQQDPRYDNDPVFRKEVIDRYRKSREAGTVGGIIARGPFSQF